MKIFDIICPSCNGVFHETTKYFDTNKPAKGYMFKAKQMVIDAGWSTFPEYETTEYGNITCPSCDGSYLDSSGKVMWLKPSGWIDDEPEPSLNELMDRIMSDYDPELPSMPNEQMKQDDVQTVSGTTDNDLNAQPGKSACPVCGEMFASRGLNVHIKAKHPEYK